MDAMSGEETEEVSRLFISFLLITSERSREFCIWLDGVLMPFFEKKIRQNYAVPEHMERELRSAMEFVATGYYRFFAKALTESARNTALEAALCARLGDACLGLLFPRKK